MKKRFLLTVLVIHSMLASAFVIKYGNDINITKPIYENVYIAGGNIHINAPIHGDLIIAGGNVTINDSVQNDILIAGGSVTFNGFAGDDIRCAGGNIRISKGVAGEVVLCGGSVTIDKGITIGHLLASGGNVTVNGIVNGKISGVFGNLYLNGTVFKDIDCRGGKLTINGRIGDNSVLAARNIVIGPEAAFYKNVRYWNSDGSMDFKQSLKNGSKSYYDASLKFDTDKWYYLGAASILWLIWYLGMALIMILIIQYLFSKTLSNAAFTVYNSTLKALGTGFLFFLVVPVAALIAFITIIGVPVGILILFSYVTLVFLATVITSTVAANWINNRYNKLWSYWKTVFVAFGLFVLLKLICMLAFVGWLILILLVCLSFGSIVLNINWKKRTQIPLRPTT